MKRAPIVLSATAAGLAATLGFHAHAPASTTTAAPVQSSSSSTGSTPPSSPSSSSSTKTVTSEVVPNQYGNVQLSVTIANGEITNIDALQLPNGDPKSAEINSFAEPILQQSALTAQSASIDAVSGATYTSEGYRTALQSALDQAGFSQTSSSAS
jgi:uncharacterized protein with FMN-binding domain